MTSMESSNNASAVKPRVLNDHLDNASFTSELCQFLTNLVKTPEVEYTNLDVDLARLRDALLHEVETESMVPSTNSRNCSESEGITKINAWYLMKLKSF